METPHEAHEDIFLQLLQCGHDFSVMETIWHEEVSREKSSSFNVAMTFQSWKQNIVTHSQLVIMLLQCGHDFSVMETNQTYDVYTYDIPLQCGHDFSVMETFYSDDPVKLLYYSLQCGHDFSVMETFRYLQCKSPLLVASMWP